MKILLVSHNFPPHTAAGTETYTAELGSRLASLGHAVHVFTSQKDISRPHLSHHERTYRGVRVHEVFNNLYYEDFRQTWDHPGIEALFAELCQRLEPDIVHFQHLMYLSAGCVEIAARRGPVLFTLHDYWLQCPRFGQRVHADGGVCHTIDFARCGTCLSTFKFGQSPAERRMGGVIAGLRTSTGINLGPLARGAAAALQKGQQKGQPKKSGGAAPEVDARAAAVMEEAARARTQALRERLIPKVDLLFSPSRFLRDRFVSEWSVPAEKIEHLRFGVDLESFGSLPRQRANRLRVAFIGTLTPIKGPHLLLEAWGKIASELRARGQLSIHGPGHYQPEYQNLLAESARAVGARLEGRLERGDVPRVLAETDLLVVPSLWYENSPLIILEALASKTPLLVSDLGGMAELVEPGASGYHFRMGDVEALARSLEELLLDPSKLDALYSKPLDLPRVDDHVAVIERRYGELLAARLPGQEPR